MEIVEFAREYWPAAVLLLISILLAVIFIMRQKQKETGLSLSEMSAGDWITLIGAALSALLALVALGMGQRNRAAKSEIKRLNADYDAQKGENSRKAAAAAKSQKEAQKNSAALEGAADGHRADAAHNEGEAIAHSENAENAVNDGLSALERANRIRDEREESD